jgi:hypothetical protein
MKPGMYRSYREAIAGLGCGLIAGILLWAVIIWLGAKALGAVR